MVLMFKVNKDSILKDYLKECGVSRTLGKKIKLYGKIYVNGLEVKNHVAVRINDEIKIELANKLGKIKKVHKDIKVLYEDEWIIIVDKEYDLAIQPSKKHSEDNLIARVLDYFSLKNESSNCHVLTRLDYPTSGIVIIAKNAYIHNLLSKTDISKKYILKTKQKLMDDIGSIQLPISRDDTSNIKRMVRIDGKCAKTLYKFIKEENNTYTYEIEIITGRTHQIRVHFSHLECPIIGDKLYGGPLHLRLLLHCYMVDFVHPLKNELIKIVSCPDNFDF